MLQLRHPQCVQPIAIIGETANRLVSSFFQDLFIDSPFRLECDSGGEATVITKVVRVFDASQYVTGGMQSY